MKTLRNSQMARTTLFTARQAVAFPTSNLEQTDLRTIVIDISKKNYFLQIRTLKFQLITHAGKYILTVPVRIWCTKYIQCYV